MHIAGEVSVGEVSKPLFRRFDLSSMCKPLGNLYTLIDCGENLIVRMI